MSVEPGSQLLHYRVTEKLGAGGMGEVYLAEDTKLGRKVALKLLPDALSRDGERLARFEREARLLASLNHPHIASLYDLEEDDGRVFLTMELAEGEDLGRHLRRGPLPVKRAIAVALQIAAGLEAAHAKGIVHRDLKPANVMLSEEDRVKLLDFGLARAYQGDEASASKSFSPTITAAMTRAGVVLGTAAYMSPEQARGKPVDKQTDIWAFGALLYEMLTAQCLFDGETVSDSIGAILHRDPDWDRLPPGVPGQVRRLLRRCIERDRELRLKDVGDARVELLDAQDNPAPGGPGAGEQAPGAARKRRLLVAAGVVVGLMLGVAAGKLFDREPSDTRFRVFDLGVRVEPSAVQRHGSRVAYAPDGHAIAFTSNDRIWVRDLSESEPFEVDGSEGGFAPFWSPDSSRVGWFTRASLWSAPVRGGRAVTICQAPDAGIAGGVTAVWTRDGQIVFTTGRAGIFAVAALGGQAKEIVATDEGTQDLHDVQVLPDGQGFLVVVHKEDGRSSVLALHRDGETQVLFEVEKNASLQHPVYDRRGYILLSMRGSERPSGLWAMRFDAAAGTVDGDPLLVEQGAAEPSLAGDGTLAFVSRPGGASRLVTTLDRNGRRGDVVLPARERLLRGTMSPDERHLAFSAPRDDPEFTQLWIRDLVRGIETPLTSLDGHVNSLGWSPDGHEIFFGVWFPDRQEVGLYRVPSDGSKEAELIEHSQLGHVSESDNSLIVLRTSDPDGWVGSRDTPLEVWRVPIDDPGAERKLLSFSTGQFMNIRSIAPNARHVLFEMFVNDQVTVFLARYPEFDRRMQVSSDHSARDPFFSADGSTIYYSAKETSVNRLFEVSFDPDAPTKLGRPQPLFELPAESYDVALGPGGEGFLLTMREQLDDAGVVDPHRGIRVVQNWTRKIEGPRP